MKESIITKEMVIAACNPILAKSRFFKRGVCFRLSGFIVSIYELTNTAFTMTLVDNPQLDTRAKYKDVITEALSELDYLTVDDIKTISRVNQKFKFFQHYFSIVNPTQKTNCLSIMDEYEKQFGKISHRLFYQHLKHWAAENQYRLIFKNVRTKRNVTVIK